MDTEPAPTINQFDLPLPEKKSSFVGQHLSNVDFVRQEIANQLQGQISGTFHMLDHFLKELEVLISNGVTVNTATGQKAITPAQVREGLGDERYSELVDIVRLFRADLNQLGYRQTPVVENFVLKGEEPVAIGQPFTIDKPGIGKSNGVTISPTKSLS